MGQHKGDPVTIGGYRRETLSNACLAGRPTGKRTHWPRLTDAALKGVWRGTRNPVPIITRASGAYSVAIVVARTYAANPVAYEFTRVTHPAEPQDLDKHGVGYVFTGFNGRRA